MTEFLIAGLGNIGDEFEDTRHNLGFRVVELFAQKHNASFHENTLANIANVRAHDTVVYLIKPTTFMNESGKSIVFWLSKLALSAKALLVIADDKDLPLGQIRIRPRGGDGRHNGLRSIAAALGDNNFPRLRFGIGSDFRPGEQINFVLGTWRQDERMLLDDYLKKTIEAIEMYVFVGTEKAMSKYNSKTAVLNCGK